MPIAKVSHDDQAATLGYKVAEEEKLREITNVHALGDAAPECNQGDHGHGERESFKLGPAGRGKCSFLNDLNCRPTISDIYIWLPMYEIVYTFPKALLINPTTNVIPCIVRVRVTILAS